MATQYQESLSGTPEFYQTGYQDLLNLGQAAANTPYTAYTGQLTAGLTPQQQQAMALAGSQVGSYQPMTTQAQTLLAQAPVTGSDITALAPQMLSSTLGSNYNAMLAAGSPQYAQAQQALTGAMGTNLAGAGANQYGQSQQAIFDAMGRNLGEAGADLYNQAQSLYGTSGNYSPSALMQYLNPYLGGVVGEIGRLGAEQLTNVINPALSSTFGGLGQQGSARQAAMMADAAARSQRETLGQQSNAISGAYNQASQDYLNWAARQQAAAAGIAGIGQQQYAQQLGAANLGLAGAQQLAGLGQQQYNQLLGQTNLGLAGAQQMANLGQQQYAQQAAASQLQEQGWQNALSNALTGGQLEYQSALGAGGALGNLAQAAQQMSLSDIGALSASGLTAQQQQQRELDAAYQQWQQQQSYPWQQLSQYKTLFPSAPQTSESWSTAFKKGGLARYADGGRFRDEPDLIEEQQQKLLSPTDYLRQANAQRQGLMQRITDSPAFASIAEPSFGEAAGQAMLQAAAENPSNLGQAIGLAGSNYFEGQRKRDAQRRQSALDQLVLEQKAMLPGTGSGASGFYMATDSDGGTWMINKATGERTPIASGDVKLNQAADAYAKDAAIRANITDTDEYARFFDARRREYIARFRGGVSEIPAKARAAGGDVERMRAEAMRLPPDQQAEVLSAIDRTYGPQEQRKPTVMLTPGEKKQTEEIGSAMGKEYADIREKGGGAAAMINALENLKANLEGYETGKLTPLGKEIAAWVAPLGIQIDPNLGKKEAFEAATGQLALQLRSTGEGAGMPGALSDKDREFLVKMAPSLGNTIEGNRLIIDYASRLAKRQKEKAEMASDYVANNPRGTFSGFDSQWRNYVEENPLFAKEQEQSKPQRIRITPEMLGVQ